MIPTIPQSALSDTLQLGISPQPSRTYALDLHSKRILGHVDGLDAIAQAVRKVLHTARYAWLIYNFDYGAELEQYIGKSIDFVAADIELEITEALMVDERVLSVQDFNIKRTDNNTLLVQFTVSTTFGETLMETEVPV